jgi:UDP-N-acetylglucosamine 2-epimerase
MFLRPTEKELEDFDPEWLVVNAPGFMADPVVDGTRQHNFAILNFTKKKDNVYFYNSLGNKVYISFMKIAYLLIGNSSSGVLETPYFGTRTINIGNRQKGRIISDNIINSDYEFKSIYKAFLTIKKRSKKRSNVFLKKNTPIKIAKKILSFKFNLKKEFYDL